MSEKPTMTLLEFVQTDRGRFYNLVAWEVYTHAWGELTDSQREHVGHLADTLAAALNTGWTKHGRMVRPPLQEPPKTTTQEGA